MIEEKLQKAAGEVESQIFHASTVLSVYNNKVLNYFWLNKVSLELYLVCAQGLASETIGQF